MACLAGLLARQWSPIFTDAIADAMDGMGQEIFNAVVLYVAVFMIGWTVVWMSTHGRQMAAKLKDVGNKVQEGELPLTAIAVVIALCVWREGAEIVLFMYGIIHTTEEPMINLFIGGAGGNACCSQHRPCHISGPVKTADKIFLQNGRMASYPARLRPKRCGNWLFNRWRCIAIHCLPMWDTSAILSGDSLIGQILHALIGYTPRPAAMQLIAYGATLLVIFRCHAVGEQQTSTQTYPANSVN